MARTFLKSKMASWLGREAAPAASETHAKFLLSLGKIPVGTLSVCDGLWRFEYSDAWKNQTQYRPITQFPDLNRVYESRELWPFFALRIPSLKQELFRQTVAREHIDPNNKAALLSHYGRHTITNPFVLLACTS